LVLFTRGTRIMRRNVAFLCLLTVALTLSPPAANAVILPPPVSRKLGAWVNPNGGPWSRLSVTTFEALIGRKLAIDHRYYAWTDKFGAGYQSIEQWDLDNGRTPLISWKGTTLTAIISGSYDSMIRARADAVKALTQNGHQATVYLRWAWEMNGDWFPWDGYHNGGAGVGPQRYVAAWRHIHDLFVAEGATNAIWTWCPNGDDVPNQSWNYFANYYPGNSYVNRVAIDGYNWGGSKWRSFAKTFSRIYSWAESDPNNPRYVMVAETSSQESGGSKAQWITDARNAIETGSFQYVAELLWFDAPIGWQITTSLPAQQAFIAMANDGSFCWNNACH
jgi:hypothetical protein